MNAFIYVAVGCLCFTLSQGASTVNPHHHHTHDPNHTHAPHTGPTKEPTEHEHFSFIYNPHVHKLILHNGHSCYLAALTADEITAVHTDSGMRALELKLLTSLTTATEVTQDTLTALEVKECGHHITHFYTM